MNKDYLETYAKFLISSSKNAYSTDLERITDSEYSKDKIYRFLSSGQFCERTFWLSIKPTIKSIQNNNACISFDDTIIHKEYMKENDVVSYYYDHTNMKCTKGINLLSCIYQINDISMPLNFRVVRKTKEKIDKNGNTKKVSEYTKNQMLRDMLKMTKVNKIKYRYVLADSWYSSTENLKYIHSNLNKLFVFAMKKNRCFKFPNEDFKQFRKLSSSNFMPNKVYQIELKGCDFPIYLSRQVFKNEDGKETSLYLITNDEFLNYENTIKVYQKRWDIEVYHKSLKQNCSLGKSLVRTVKTIIGHVFASIYAYYILEKIKIKTKENQFQIKTRYYLGGLKKVFTQLKNLKIA